MMIKAQGLVEAGKELLDYSKQVMIPYVNNGMTLAGMDCQGLCEYLLMQCGLTKAEVNLAGSNAHWRQSYRWRGSVEEAVALFGDIPDGAWLFIHAYDGGEPDQYKGDGQGNASHMGQYLGGLVAVHASGSRGFVAESAVKRKSINGGWNAVILPRWVQFSDKVESILARIDGRGDTAPEMSEEEYLQEPTGEVPGEPSGTMAASRYFAMVSTPNGGPANMRAEPSTSCDLYKEVPNGETVQVIGQVVKNGRTWSRVERNSRKWYIASEYLKRM